MGDGKSRETGDKRSSEMRGCTLIIIKGGHLGKVQCFFQKSVLM